MTIFRSIAFAAALGLCAACTSQATAPQKSGDAAATAEQQSVDALQLKNRYKDVVVGAEVQGSTLVLYANENELLSMDTTAEDDMIANTLDKWKAIWRKAHPHKHAKLRLSVRDYYGKEITGAGAPA